MSRLVKPPHLTDAYEAFSPEKLLIIGSDIRDAQTAISLQRAIVAIGIDSCFGHPDVTVPPPFNEYARQEGVGKTARNARRELREGWEESLPGYIGGTTARQLLIIQPSRGGLDAPTAYMLGFARGAEDRFDKVFYKGSSPYAADVSGVIRVFDAVNTFGWHVPETDTPPLRATTYNLAN